MFLYWSIEDIKIFPSFFHLILGILQCSVISWMNTSMPKIHNLGFYLLQPPRLAVAIVIPLRRLVLFQLRGNFAAQRQLLKCDLWGLNQYYNIFESFKNTQIKHWNVCAILLHFVELQAEIISMLIVSHLIHAATLSPKLTPTLACYIDFC